MPLQTPTIDNRTYQDIVKEARARIPRYTPEWTDLNDNDPGIALVQLFAWMTELLIYRMNQVPDLNYIEFLKLLGIDLAPAEPATTEITFPLSDSQAEQSIIIPQHTQVAVAGDVGSTPVIFETDQALIALAAQIQKVFVYSAGSYVDFTAANMDATEAFHAFGNTPNAGDSLFLGFNYPDQFGGQKNTFPRTQINLAFFVKPQKSTAAVSACGLPDSQVFPSAKLVWEYWDVASRAWLALSQDKDTTLALNRSGHIYLRVPDTGRLLPDKIAPAIDTSFFWVRARIDTPGYEIAPELIAVRTNTISATQAQTQRDEVLGGSDATPNQTFTLTFQPVIENTLELQVDQGDGDGFADWTRVSDFFASGPDDMHYVLNRTTGEVRFGNGTHGRIPTANPDNPDGNIVARFYRHGGGSSGNVAAGNLSNMPGFVAGVDANSVSNLQAAVGGQDEETLEEARFRAPQELKNKCRAVTAEDFESLAEQVAGVQRANALPLTNPDFPGVAVPGAVTVVIVPGVSDPSVRNPTPSEGLIRTVCAYLYQRCLITTELYVTAPVYRLIRIRADIVSEGSADLSEVTQDIEKVLLKYLHPLTGGEDGTGWPFGGAVLFSQIFRQILDVNGVQSAENVVINLDGDDQPVCKDVPIGIGELVYSSGHDILVTYPA